ncbi:MAG TPA: HlyD family secretion protein [Kofleriaceae bacterium]|nr:HlyD family secretion protein [Kofleriaceae bacterium]
MEASVKDKTPRARRGKRAYLILGIVASVVAVLWLVHRWYTHGKQKTDDAQVEADVVPIAPRVAGTIMSTKVTDNQAVKKGDVLFEIDPANLDAEVMRAEAELEAARAQLSAAQAQVAIVQSSSKGGLSSAQAALTGASASVRGSAASVRAAEAAVARAQADLKTAQIDFDKVQQLFAKEAVTRHEVDQATNRRDVAQAALQSAQAQLDAARDQRNMAQARVSEAEGKVAASAPVDQQVAAAQAAADLATARVKSAEAALAKAKLDRAHATITAPTDGVISKLGAHVGQSVNVGQPLLMLVPNETYVIANFKEGQIAHMKAGDKVEIELDAYDGEFDGIVDTLSPATGARFSMIPPDNATGNFVKVVQRVPVKIRWAKPPGVPVKPGLSAEVIVRVAD